MTYTNYYAGPGGASGNSGLSYAARKLTLSQVEAILAAATRATVYAAPGTYRETLTAAVSGPAPYTTGTVSVTAGSLTVTGSGTSWLANTELNDFFQVLQFAHGTDGVTNGTSTFTAAAGNFQAGHVGMTIRIDTKVAGVIATVVSATQITIKDTAGVDVAPTAGSGLTYDVGPSGPIKVASVESNTSLTLAAAWDFPTLTGLAYQTWGHVEYIGDYTGVNTDGVGGGVRITGSDNDQTATRANCITATSKNQRMFIGFQLDTGSSTLLTLITACSNWVVDKLVFQSFVSAGPISFAGTGSAVTISNSLIFALPLAGAVAFTHSSVVSNCAGVVQNCLMIGGIAGVAITRVGGVLIRNCMFMAEGSSGALRVGTALTVGQAMTVNNCIVCNSTLALTGTVVGEVQEDYNALPGNTTNRTNTTAGAHSNTYPALFDPRWFFQLAYAGAGPNSPLQVVSPFDLASYSQLVNLAGTSPPALGLRGTAIIGAAREWGPLEYDSTLKLTGSSARARYLMGM